MVISHCSTPSQFEPEAPKAEIEAEVTAEEVVIVLGDRRYRIRGLDKNLSLFYMGETNLKNKILAIAEEEGAENASYALKLLQSEGVLTIASTGKDETTGNLVTKQYRVEGPVMPRLGMVLPCHKFCV